MTTYAKDKKLAVAMEAYILANMDKPLTLKALSKVFGVSSFTLQRVCNLIFDMPVHHLVLRIRLGKAYNLITETNLPIKQIISETGFKSISTFTHEFYGRYHKTPGALRNEG